MSARDVIINLKLRGTEGAQLLRAKLAALKPAGQEAAAGMTTAEVNSAKLTAVLSRLEAKLGQVETKAAGVSGQMKLFALAAGAAFAGSKLTQGFEDAIEQAIDFETKMSSIRKTTGLSGEGLNALRDNLTDLATTFGGFKISELLDVAAIGGRLGIAKDQIAGFARNISMITVALEDIPAEEAATSIARTLNVFHRGADQAINFASALNKLDDSSTATGRDILDVTRRISGAAAALGLAPQKVLALATAPKDAGVENEVAGSAMTQVLSGMATHAEKFAMVAGVSMQRFAMTMKRDPLAALQLFMRGLKQLDGASQMEVLEHLGLDGVRTKTTLLQLGATIGKVTEYTKTAQAEWKGLGSILDENRIAGATTAGQLDRMHAAWQKISIEIGTAALPVVQEWAVAMVRLSGNIGGFLKAHEPAILKIAAGFKTAAGNVGLLVDQWGTFVELGKEFGLEKFEQLAFILDRIGTQIGSNFGVAMFNATTLLGNAFHGMGIFIESFFDQLGGIAASKFAKSLATTLPDFVLKIIRKLDPEIARGLEALQTMPTPGFHPNTSGLTPAALRRGVQALPGFVNPFNDPDHPLPNRADRIDPLLGRLDQAKKVNAALDERHRRVLEPKSAKNPFEGRTKEDLEIEGRTNRRARIHQETERQKLQRGELTPELKQERLWFTQMGVEPGELPTLADYQARNLGERKRLAKLDQQRREAEQERVAKLRPQRGIRGAPRPANPAPAGRNAPARTPARQAEFDARNAQAQAARDAQINVGATLNRALPGARAMGPQGPIRQQAPPANGNQAALGAAAGAARVGDATVATNGAVMGAMRQVVAVQNRILKDLAAQRSQFAALGATALKNGANASLAALAIGLGAAATSDEALQAMARNHEIAIRRLQQDMGQVCVRVQQRMPTNTNFRGY